MIWVGTDDGNVQVTRDGGKTWRNTSQNLRGIAPFAWISTIEASPHDGGTAFVAASHWQTGDYTPYVYMTRDYGASWTLITANLPLARLGARGAPGSQESQPALSRARSSASTRRGTGAAAGTTCATALSAAPVRDLLVHPRDNDLIIATHGRGLYILDDITPLQQLGPAMTAAVTLFDPMPAIDYVMWSRDGNLGQKVFSGDNPPSGAP